MSLFDRVNCVGHLDFNSRPTQQNKYPPSPRLLVTAAPTLVMTARHHDRVCPILPPPTPLPRRLSPAWGGGLRLPAVVRWGAAATSGGRRRRRKRVVFVVLCGLLDRNPVHYSHYIYIYIFIIILPNILGKRILNVKWKM